MKNKGLAVVTLLLALGGLGIGIYSFISMNQYINAKNAYIVPMARVYYSGVSYTIPSGVSYVTLDYNAKSFDTHEAFNLLLNAYIIPETGFYHMIAQYSIGADTDDFYQILLFKNGNLISEKAYTSSRDTSAFGVSISDVHNFTEGDSLTIRAYQYNVGSLPRTIFDGEEFTFFTIMKVS